MSGLKMIKNAKEKSADIWIYEDIGEGWFGGFSAKQFAEELKDLGDVTQLNVYINSPGGEVFDGVAIYNQLRRHRANVTVEVDALAASIASVVAMAGDTIRMAENSLMMIHDPWGFVIGNAADMRSAADDIEKIRDNAIVPAYAKKTGMEDSELLALMADETWMSAADALEYGFIDEVVAEKKMAARFDPKKYNFKNTPEKLTEDPPEEPQEPIRLEKWQRRIAARARRAGPDKRSPGPASR